MIEATECEQCDGTGWSNGHRCPCREEDDTAAARRRRMGLVKSTIPNAELLIPVDRKAGFMKRQKEAE